MGVLKKIKHYFIGKALELNDDPFERAKIEVLFKFSLFFFCINVPYTILSFSSDIVHLISAFAQDVALFCVIYILKKGKNIKLAVNFFILNFASQNLLHFLINNGQIKDQGIIFFLLFCLYAFLLISRKWGIIISFLVAVMLSIGIYNGNTGNSLFNFPPELADPTTTKEMAYISLLPLFLLLYLVSEFVKAQTKAKELLHSQKKMVEQKNKEVIDSIKYAKRIQNALITSEKNMERMLNKDKS